MNRLSPSSQHGRYRRGKRLFDIVFAGVALLLTWPLIVLGIVLIKLTSPGPALYRARRAGYLGRPFDLLKLRTMRIGADSPSNRVTAERDPRVTPAGAVLRGLSIDELPQFWNVLRGDLSVVGPRPEDWEIVQRHYSPEDRRALEVRPGVVSPSTVRWYPDFVYHDPPPAGVPVQDHYVHRHLPVQIAEARHYNETATFADDLAVICGTLYCICVRSWWKPRRRPLPALGDRGLGGVPRTRT